MSTEVFHLELELLDELQDTCVAEDESFPRPTLLYLSEFYELIIVRTYTTQLSSVTTEI